MDQGPRLAANGLGHLGMAVAEIAYGDTGEEIQVLLAFGIPDARAFTAYQGQFPFPVGIDNVVVAQILDFFCVHKHRSRFGYSRTRTRAYPALAGVEVLVSLLEVSLAALSEAGFVSLLDEEECVSPEGAFPFFL